MDTEEDIGETENHEEGTEDHDERELAYAWVSENDKGNDAAYHTAGDPEEAVGQVFETDEANDDIGDAAN